MAQVRHCALHINSRIFQKSQKVVAVDGTSSSSSVLVPMTSPPSAWAEEATATFSGENNRRQNAVDSIPTPPPSLPSRQTKRAKNRVEKRGTELRPSDEGKRKGYTSR
uniref:Uncharacterized protein n=1 Tax=Pristionchus pacificus TaxID=54126 RepID=A0A2A6B5C4_PRIPA|eukprot:PDM61076.1 hypothetical protein PRIPAC_54882 [Pristionchus pacificus]